MAVGQRRTQQQDIQVWTISHADGVDAVRQPWEALQELRQRIPCVDTGASSMNTCREILLFGRFGQHLCHPFRSTVSCTVLRGFTSAPAAGL